MNQSSPFMRKPLTIAISALLAAVSFNTFAADSNTSAAADSEKDVVKVWATQVNSEDSLLAEDIDSKQADHLSDLLRDQAGVDIGGSRSIVQVINIRGVSESDLNITTDGVTQRNNMFHHAGNLLINTDILKEVDIKVGTNSVLTGGLSGGIEFETKDAKDLLRGDEKFGVRLHTSYGSNDYLASSATLYSQLTDDVDGLAYFTYSDKNNPDDGNGTEIGGNDGDIQDGLFKLGWDINDSNRVEVKYDKYKDVGEYYMRSNFGQGYNQTQDTQYTEYTRETFLLAHELDKGDAIKMRSSLYNSELQYQTAVSEHTGVKVLAESKVSASDINHTFKYGFEGDHLEAGSTNTSERDKINSGAVYAEDEMQFTERFFLTPGVRYNYHSVDFYAAGGAGLDKTFTDYTFGLAGRYLLTDHWTVKASSTQLFEGPATRESFYKRGSSVSADLKPETGVNNEVGVAFQKQNFASLDSFGFSTKVFRTQIDNYLNETSNSRGTYGNDSDYTLQGFESVLSASKGQLDGRLTYSHSDSANDDTGYALGTWVGDSMSLGLAYNIPSIDMNVQWTSLVTFGDTKMEAGRSGPTAVHKEGYDVHGISANWMPVDVDGLTVTAGIENLFDEQYYSHASSGSAGAGTTDYEPGRNFKLSVSYSF